MNSKVNKSADYYFSLLYPDISTLDKDSYEAAMIDKRFIEENIDRINELFNSYLGGQTLDNIQKKLKASKISYFRDIFLNEYSDFEQKENFGGEEKEEFDAKQREIHDNLELLKKHIDKALKMYYIEIDNGCTPIQALNKVIDYLKAKILPSQVLVSALNSGITIKNVRQSQDHFQDYSTEKQEERTDL